MDNRDKKIGAFTEEELHMKPRDLHQLLSQEEMEGCMRCAEIRSAYQLREGCCCCGRLVSDEEYVESMRKATIAKEIAQLYKEYKNAWDEWNDEGPALDDKVH